MLGLFAEQFGVEHLVTEEDQCYYLYHSEEVLLPDAHTEHLYYYPSASLNYIKHMSKDYRDIDCIEWNKKGKNYWLVSILKQKGKILQLMVCNSSSAEIFPFNAAHAKRAVSIGMLMVKVIVCCYLWLIIIRKPNNS